MKIGQENRAQKNKKLLIKIKCKFLKPLKGNKKL